MSNPIVQDLDHIGVVVPSMDKAVAFWNGILGFPISEDAKLVGHLRIKFVNLPSTKIELIEPLDPNCDQAIWLKSHPDGGLHHICFKSEKLSDSSNAMVQKGIKTCTGVIELLNGAHIQFFEPKDASGVLIEFIE